MEVKEEKIMDTPNYVIQAKEAIYTEVKVKK